MNRWIYRHVSRRAAREALVRRKIRRQLRRFYGRDVPLAFVDVAERAQWSYDEMRDAISATYRQAGGR